MTPPRYRFVFERLGRGTATPPRVELDPNGEWVRWPDVAATIDELLEEQTLTDELARISPAYRDEPNEPRRSRA